jgi:rod shape-determining protein MreD
MGSTLYFAAPLMLFVAILQTAVLPRFPVAGTVPQLPLLIALSWGLLRGPNDGTIWGFLAGLFLDIFSVGPIGVTALSYMFAILAVTLVGRALPSNRYLMPILFSAMVTFVYFLLNLILMRLYGYSVGPVQVSNLLPLMLLHTGMILPFYWAFYALDRRLRPRSVSL